MTCRVDDVDHAMTANSFTSVSLEPLLVLVCVERNSRFHEAIVASDRWAVSILPRDAESTSRWLATKGRPLDGQLDSVAHHTGPETGAALLDGALASLECRTEVRHVAGDHDIVVGRVLAIETEQVDDPQDPLLYFRRTYRGLT